MGRAVAGVGREALWATATMPVAANLAAEQGCRQGLGGSG